MKQTICITGMDGTGKSTLIAGLGKLYGSAAIATIWDIMDGSDSATPFTSRSAVDAYLCKLSPDSRTLFLAHALKFSIDTAFRSNKDIVLINSYYYKYLASELALGASPTLMEKLISAFPIPDKVICLELPVEDAALRKQKFSRYECGLASHPNMESFISFQTKVIAVWKKFKQPGWHPLSARDPIESVIEQAQRIIGL